MKSKSYHESLIKRLRKDPALAAEYLNVNLEEDDAEFFLVALRNVAEAHGGMAKLARLSGLNRANLYKMLSKHGHPEIQSVYKILDSFGFTLSVSPKNRAARLKRAA